MGTRLASFRNRSRVPPCCVRSSHRAKRDELSFRDRQPPKRRIDSAFALRQSLRRRWRFDRHGPARESDSVSAGPPKEQPPRNLSGTSDRVWLYHSGKRLWTWSVATPRVSRDRRSDEMGK